MRYITTQGKTIDISDDTFYSDIEKLLSRGNSLHDQIEDIAIYIEKQLDIYYDIRNDNFYDRNYVIDEISILLRYIYQNNNSSYSMFYTLDKIRLSIKLLLDILTNKITIKFYINN